MQVPGEILDHVHHSRRQDIGAVGEDVRERVAQEAQALAYGYAALQQEGPDLVDDGGALADQAGTNPMQCLQVELVDTLGGDKAHGGTLYGLGLARAIRARPHRALPQQNEEWGKSFVGLVPDFELTFERCEVLGSLAHLERNEKNSVQTGLAAQTQNAWTWMPVGRAGWHESNADKLLSDIQTEPMKSALLKAGFAKGDAEFLDLFVQNFKRIAGRMRWQGAHPACGTWLYSLRSPSRRRSRYAGSSV